MELRGKTVVITGASAGIGRELASQLAARGARLALAARSAEALETTRQECQSAGADALGVVADVAQADDCRRLVEQAVARFAGIDVMVNNAGISMHARFDEITDLGLFSRLMEVNFLGTVYCTHFALPHLKRSGGLLVGISSLQGKTGFPYSTGYSASKHAMQGFFDSLRMELAGSGVDVLVVSPGPVATTIHTRRLAGDGKLTDESHKYPNDRGMPVDECARQIVVAIERRRRELVMTATAKVGQWMKLLAPELTDRFVARAVERFRREQ